jgi:hypothetical protein
MIGGECEREQPLPAAGDGDDEAQVERVLADRVAEEVESRHGLLAMDAGATASVRGACRSDITV